MDDLGDVEILSQTLLTYLRSELEDPGVDFISPLVQLQGGYETATYRFELGGVPDELSRPLVLRLYPPRYGPYNAMRESTVQNVLARAGYPVAKAYLLCTDAAVLGGAFYIMDWLPGEPLITAPIETVLDLLGQLHAQLHSLEPGPLIEAFSAKGIPPRDYVPGDFRNRLTQIAEQHPWLAQAARWLLSNYPGEPERLVVCHGDFHPLNVLYADGEVTGILDWPGFAIGDPVYDVASSMVLISIPSKYVLPPREDLVSVDWDSAAEQYLSSYRAHRPLDGTNLAYYRVRRCVLALAEGAEGQAIWQHPAIVRDLAAYILEVTGVRVAALEAS